MSKKCFVKKVCNKMLEKAQYFLEVYKTDPCDLKVSKPKHDLVYTFFTYTMVT